MAQCPALFFLAYVMSLVVVSSSSASPPNTDRVHGSLHRMTWCQDLGPVCTDLGPSECCKDHLDEHANYFRSARIEFEDVEQGTGYDFWSGLATNENSTCVPAPTFTYQGPRCLNIVQDPTENPAAYGVFWYRNGSSPASPAVNPTTARAGRAKDGKCTRSRKPDVYHIKASPEAIAIPLSRKIAVDYLYVAGAVDWKTQEVKDGKLDFFKGVVEKHGNGLSARQVEVLHKLRPWG